MNDSIASGTSRISAAELRRIDALCDEFEEIRARGKSAAIESFLPRVNERIRPVLLEFLLLVEIDVDGATKFQSEIDSIRGRFPDYLSVVEGVLATLDDSPNSVTHNGGATESPSGANGPAPLTAPQKIGRFRIETELGQGAFGAVYRAFDEFLQRVVALKLPLTEVTSEDAKRRLRREAESAAQLHHPHIVPLFDAGEADGLFWISSALIDGYSLKRILVDGRRFSTAEAVSLIIKLADALDYAHRRGVVHRDVTPNNILIDAAGEPYLVDFGLAFRLEGGADAGLQQEPPSPDHVLLSQAGKMVGTPGYMSPEQAAAEIEKIDGRSDIWGLGVVLYELLSGRLPFGSRLNPFRVRFVEPLPLRDAAKHVSADLHAVCHKCLAKDQSRRFQTGGELAEELRRWARGEPVKSRRIGTVERLTRLSRRFPRTSALVATAILLVAATIGAIAYGYRQTSAALAEAEVQRSHAEDQRAVAEDRGLELKAQKVELEKQNLDLVKKDSEMAIQSYAQRIDLSRQYLENGRPELAWATLSRCPERLRGWEFRYLEDRIRRERGTAIEPGYSIFSLALDPDGRHVTYMRKDGTVEIVRSDGGCTVRTLMDLKTEDDSWQRSDLEFCDGRRLLGCRGKQGVIWRLDNGAIEFSWQIPHDVTCTESTEVAGQLTVFVGDVQGSVYEVDVAAREVRPFRPPTVLQPAADENADNEKAIERYVRSAVVGGRKGLLAIQTSNSEVEFWNRASKELESRIQVEDDIIAHSYCSDEWWCVLANGNILIYEDGPAPKIIGKLRLEDCLAPDEWESLGYDFLAVFNEFADTLFISDKTSYLYQIAIENTGLRKTRRLAIPDYTEELVTSWSEVAPVCALRTTDFDGERIEIRPMTQKSEQFSAHFSKTTAQLARASPLIRLSSDGRFVSTPHGLVIDSYGLRRDFTAPELEQPWQEIDRHPGSRTAGWDQVQIEGARFDDARTTCEIFGNYPSSYQIRFTAPNQRTEVEFWIDKKERQLLLNYQCDDFSNVSLDSTEFGSFDVASPESVIFSPSNERFVTRDEDCYLWSTSTSRPVGKIPDYDDEGARDLPITFTPDSRYVAYATVDGDVKLIDFDGKMKARQFKAAHSGKTVYGIAFLPDGTRMVTIGADGAIKLWDVHTAQVTATIPGTFISWPAVSSDGTTIAALDANGEIRHLRAPSSRKHTYASDSDIDALLSAASTDGANARRSSLESAQGGEVRHQSMAQFEHSIRDANRASVLALSQDDRFLATGYEDGTIRLWHLSTMHVLEHWSAHDRPVSSLRFLPDGRLASSTSSGAIVWSTMPSEESARRPWEELSLQEQLKRLDDPPTTPRHFFGHTSNISCLATDGSGRYFASMDVDGNVRCWDLEHPTQYGAEFNCGPVSHPTTMVLSRDATRIAFGPDCSGDVLVADPKSGRVLQRIHAPGSNQSRLDVRDREIRLRLSSDGRTLALAVSQPVGEGCSLSAWNTENGNLLWHVDKPEANFCKLEMDSLNRVLSAEWKHKSEEPFQTHWSISHYDLVTGKEVSIDPPSPIVFPQRKPQRYDWFGFDAVLQRRAVQNLPWLFGDDGDLGAVCDLHADGRHLLVWAIEFRSSLAEVMIYDLATGRRAWSAIVDGGINFPLSPSFGFTCRFTGDGKSIVGGGIDGIVRVWDVPVGILHPWNLPPEENGEREKSTPPAGLEAITARLEFIHEFAHVKTWNACFESIDLAATDPKAALALLDREAQSIPWPELVAARRNEYQSMINHIRGQIVSLTQTSAKMDPAVAEQLLRQIEAATKSSNPAASETSPLLPPADASSVPASGPIRNLPSKQDLEPPVNPFEAHEVPAPQSTGTAKPTVPQKSGPSTKPSSAAADSFAPPVP